MHLSIIFLFSNLALPLCSAKSNSGFYASSKFVKDISAADFKSNVMESPLVSVVEFYAPWCGHCQNLKSEYVKAAKSTQGLINMVAVNCDEDSNKPLCAQYDVKGFPTIKVFQAPKNKTIKTKAGKKIRAWPTIEDYQGRRDADSIASFAISRIQNKVKYLDSTAGLDGFLESSSYPKIVYLAVSKSSKKPASKSIPPVFKVLALVESSSAFGYVPPASTSAKIENIHEKLHSKNHEKGVLLVISEKDEKPTVYDGEMRKEAILEFLAKLKSEKKRKGAAEESKSTTNKNDSKKTVSAKKESKEEL